MRLAHLNSQRFQQHRLIFFEGARIGQFALLPEENDDIILEA